MFLISLTELKIINLFALIYSWKVVVLFVYIWVIRNRNQNQIFLTFKQQSNLVKVLWLLHTHLPKKKDNILFRFVIGI